jgi:hypothetical protein
VTPGLILALFLAPASAQDDEWDLDDDIEFEPAPAPAPAPAPTSGEPTPPPQPDDGDDKDEGLEEFRDPDGEEIDLLEGEEQTTTLGADTEAVYRATAERLAKLGNDEELAGWEEYLATYPNTVFRKRIETRMEELMDELYAEGVRRPGDGGVDAMKQEIGFAQAMQLENIDPRRRIQVGFEWGLPDYMNLMADYEHQIVRTLSVHGGVRRRYQGWSVEVGPRWALVKSTRTNTLVTLIGDFHFYGNPFFPAFRPQLAAGKRLGKVDIQAQGGVDLEMRIDATNPDSGLREASLQSRILGGANVFFAASDRVGLFAETYLFMKPQPADGAFDGGLFAFNVVTFGMKFFPSPKSNPDSRDMEVNLGATVPYMQEWWRFHYGSIMGQMNYYLD